MKNKNLRLLFAIIAFVPVSIIMFIIASMFCIITLLAIGLVIMECCRYPFVDKAEKPWIARSITGVSMFIWYPATLGYKMLKNFVIDNELKLPTV